MEFYIRMHLEDEVSSIQNSWLKDCISLVSYSIITNNEPKWFGTLVTPSKGLSQRDSLSPNMCILCLKVLNHALLSKANSQTFGIGVMIYLKFIKFSCLLCANDNLIFCKSNLNICNLFKNVFDISQLTILWLSQVIPVIYKNICNRRIESFWPNTWVAN